MSSSIDNNEFARIGRKHDNKKSHSIIAERQSKKREGKMEQQQLGSSPKNTHLKQTNRKTYFKDDNEITNQYQETIQGEEDAYAEIEKEGRDQFFEEHFRLLKELNEEEYQDYLNNVHAVNTRVEDMSGCEWIMVNDQIENYETRRNNLLKELDKGGKEYDLSESELEAYKEHLGDLASLKMYYEETDAVINPGYLEELKTDIANFNGRTPYLSHYSHELIDDLECCSEEWMEMVDEVNREQGYY